MHAGAGRTSVNGARARGCSITVAPPLAYPTTPFFHPTLKAPLCAVVDPIVCRMASYSV